MGADDDEIDVRVPGVIDDGLSDRMSSHDRAASFALDPVTLDQAFQGVARLDHASVRGRLVALVDDHVKDVKLGAGLPGPRQRVDERAIGPRREIRGAQDPTRRAHRVTAPK
jgi:hypothetical protein